MADTVTIYRRDRYGDLEIKAGCVPGLVPMSWNPENDLTVRLFASAGWTEDETAALKDCVDFWKQAHHERARAAMQAAGKAKSYEARLQEATNAQ